MNQKQYAYFSGAMRAGIKMFPAIHGPYTQRNAANEICGTCAVGAGLVAAGLGESAAAALDAYSYLAKEAVCPVDECFSKYPYHLNASLWDVCIQLFECHGWTREAVADWLFLEEEKLGFVTLVEATQEAEVKGQLYIAPAER